jgi:acetolactate synthase small subunit
MRSIQQIANQLNKLVDVVNVLDMTRGAPRAGAGGA